MEPLMYTDSSLINNSFYHLKIQKTKVIPLSFVFCLLSFFLKGQVNYVQNPSFELGPCTAINFQPQPPDFWDTLRAGGGGGPEYCTPCSIYTLLTVPKNGYQPSFQIPKSGSRYCFYTNYYSNDLREYIQNELRQNLKAGKNYCVTYHLSLMNESKYAITEFGAYFDNGSIKTAYYGASTLTPQVKSPEGVLLTDTLGWITVQGSFTANGTEKYLTLGNFKTNAATTFSLMGFGQRIVADYYVDDVSVIESDLPAYAGRDTVLCTGDSIFIGRPPEIGLECLWFNTSTGSVQIASGGGLWVKPATTQTYIVQQDICGLIKTDTIKVQVKPKYNGPNIGLIANTATACPTNTVILTVSNNPPGANSKYNWLPAAVYTQTGSAGANAMIPQSTTFTLNITNNGENTFCPFQRSDTVMVTAPVFTDNPVLVSNAVIVCPQDSIILSLQNSVPGNTVTYQWLPSPAFTFTSNLIAKSLINQSLTYTLNINSSGTSSICAYTRTLNITVTVADTCFKEPSIPNIFTPNNDNVNDVWSIKFPFGYSLQYLEVYNRWGTLIYKIENLSFKLQNLALIGWDGRTNSGEQCSAGVYFYVLNYADKNGVVKVVKGNVTLVK